MNGEDRKDIRSGSKIGIVLKQDQRSGEVSRSTVKDVLTKSSLHPHGIKGWLETGEVGRVKEMVEESKQLILALHKHAALESVNRSSVHRDTDHCERQMRNEPRSPGRRYWQVRDE